MSGRSRAKPWFRDPRFELADIRNGALPDFWHDPRTGLVWTRDGRFFGDILPAVLRAEQHEAGEQPGVSR